MRHIAEAISSLSSSNDADKPVIERWAQSDKTAVILRDDNLDFYTARRSINLIGQCWLTKALHLFGCFSQRFWDRKYAECTFFL